MMSNYTRLGLCVALALSATACDKGNTESGAASAASSGDAKAPAAGAKAAVDGEAAFDTWMKTIGDPKRSSDPFDDRLKEWKAVAGEPHKTEGKDMYWYFWNAKDKYCREFKTIGTAGGSSSSTDKSSCGK